MVRATGVPALFFLLSAAVRSDTLPAQPTATFTLDVQRRELVPSQDHPIDEQTRSWARTCSVVSAEPLFSLQCRAVPPARHEASQDEPDGIEGSLVLFQDLDEVLYVAGCPVVEELPEAELEFRP